MGGGGVSEHCMQRERQRVMIEQGGVHGAWLHIYWPTPHIICITCDIARTDTEPMHNRVWVTPNNMCMFKWGSQELQHT